MLSLIVAYLCFIVFLLLAVRNLLASVPSLIALSSKIPSFLLGMYYTF